MEHELMINSKTIRVLRKKAGWSQEQLAQASGLSLRTIQRVENEGKASTETKVCLAATFDVEIDQLEDNTTQRQFNSYSKIAIMLFLIFGSISLLGLLMNIYPTLELRRLSN